MKIGFNRLATLTAIAVLAFGAASVQSAGQAQANNRPVAASPPDEPVTTMSVQVKVVNVLATVRDKHGKIANGLTKDDFSLTEDGRPQTLKYFARDTDLPLTLGLLVDTSMSQRRVLNEERDASESFLAQVLREDKDKAFVIHFDREVELSQDLTSSHEQLRTALESLQTPQFTRTSGGGGGSNDPGSGRGRGSGRHGGGTLLYDAVFLASDELMKKQPGRKAVIVLSDGVDMGSRESLEAAIESAQRANTIVYSILFKDDEAYGNGGGFGRTGISIPGMGVPGMGRGGMGGPGGRGGRRYPEEHADGKKILERISRETGGRMFEVSKKEPVNQIYSQIQEELRNQYSLGYTPNPVEPGYHKIQVTASRKDLIVQARDGYYGDK
ncbi:MAG TPA: VWA domain-containing protein [Terriglobales bacterium]|nr:VWA domain-containing protein [Terriglobales bacterium]